MIQVLDLAGKHNFLFVFNENFMATWIDMFGFPELFNLKIECIWICKHLLVCHACYDTECS